MRLANCAESAKVETLDFAGGLSVSLFLVFAAALAAPQSASTQAPLTIEIRDEQHHVVSVPGDPGTKQAQLQQAKEIVTQGHPEQALPLLDQIIAAGEAIKPTDGSLVFSAPTMTEALMYATLGTEVHKPVIVLDGNLATAHWLRGFALVDLGRDEDAKADLDRAIALAPMNGLFFAERAEWFKTRRDWESAFADFESANSYAGFAPDDDKAGLEARSFRGMAFVRVEQGKLDEAKSLLKKALRAEPDNPRTKADLADVEARLHAR